MLMIPRRWTSAAGSMVTSARTHLHCRHDLQRCPTVSYISQYMTLEPGDVISTGTPEGVVFGMKGEGMAQTRR